MAALFSLGTGQEEDQEENNSNAAAPQAPTAAVNGLFLFGNEEIYGANNKGLEIWQQFRQPRPPPQQQHPHHQLSQGMGLSYFPGAAGALGMDLRGGTTTFNVFDEPLTTAARPPSGIGGGMMSGGGSSRQGGGSGGGGINCQDCGNQAKKDCAHHRCRTCCKSRGFPCPTHVKSTWVPAEKRRQRQQQLAALQQQQQQQRGGDNNNPANKRLRGENPSSALVCTRIPTTPSGDPFYVFIYFILSSLNRIVVKYELGKPFISYDFFPLSIL